MTRQSQLFSCFPTFLQLFSGFVAVKSFFFNLFFFSLFFKCSSGDLWGCFNKLTADEKKKIIRSMHADYFWIGENYKAAGGNELISEIQKVERRGLKFASNESCCNHRLFRTPGFFSSIKPRFINFPRAFVFLSRCVITKLKGVGKRRRRKSKRKETLETGLVEEGRIFQSPVQSHNYFSSNLPGAHTHPSLRAEKTRTADLVKI